MRTIAHLSDLHFGRVDDSLREPLRRTLREIAPHLLVVSGDLTQRARAAQFREARDYLLTLPGPQLIVPGNHDVPLYNVFQRFLLPLRKYKRIITTDLEPTFMDDEIAVVGVNTARALVFKGGRINEEQAERVRAKLCDLPQRMTKIVVTHHPFNVPDGSPEEDQILGRARMALEKLAGCGADVLLSGHLHKAHVGHTASRYHIAGVSALVVHAGTALSTRSRGEPNTFNVLRVRSRHIDIERWAWNGQAFGVDSVESFDHDAQGWHESGSRDAAA
jgi:3',5'-cyclic AMP phosphodiesterase CpdA